MISNLFTAIGRGFTNAAQAVRRGFTACITAIRSLSPCCRPETNEASQDLEAGDPPHYVIPHIQRPSDASVHSISSSTEQTPAQHVTSDIQRPSDASMHSISSSAEQSSAEADLSTNDASNSGEVETKENGMDRLIEKSWNGLTIKFAPIAEENEEESS